MLENKLNYNTAPTNKAILLLVVVGSIFLQSCHRKNSDLSTSYIDTAFKIMERLGKEATFQYLDSVRSTTQFKDIDAYRLHGYKHNYYLHRGKNYDSALAYADSMLSVINRHSDYSWDSYTLLNANNAKADAYFFGGDYKTAYKWYNKNEEYIVEANSHIKGIYSFRIAMALYKSERYYEATNYFKQSLRSYIKSAKKVNQHIRVQETFNNIGLSYYHLDMHDSSLLYYNTALAYIEGNRTKFPHKKTSWQRASTIILGNIGDLYASGDMYDSAEHYLQQCITIDSALGINFSDMLQKRINLAEVYLKQSMYEKVKIQLDSVSSHVSSQGVKLRYTYYNVLWKYYQANGNAEQGFESLQTCVLLKDSLFIQKKAILIDDLKAGIRENEKEIFEKNRKLKNKSIVALVSICFSLLLAVIWLIGLIVRRRKKIKIQNQSLEEIAWLHSHRIRKPVATMKGLINVLNKEDPTDPENEYILSSLLEQLQELDDYIQEITKKTY